jgi:squalene-hopene/tetraprenyl-beta-curcumene cyclase
MISEEARSTLDRLIARLLDERTSGGHWTGELSSSALSTATAVVALQMAGGREALVKRGLDWLEATQNEDRGWGDTILSISNISTTALCWAAFTLCGRKTDSYQFMLRRAGSLEPKPLATAIAARYGNDQTFSVPILTVLAVAGLVPWRIVPQLPFELAACPQACFRWLELPVVSYALPALIAIGHARYRSVGSWNPLRHAAAGKTLNVLERIQPDNGGFLEATPLTSFVSISLQAAGYADSVVLRKGLGFLEASVLPDGSWPIDTNLATWVTTLSVNALRERMPADGRVGILNWLLAQQYRVTHPYTGASPGGWSWTDLPGGVPDADDTSGALIALRTLGGANDAAAAAGVRWLLDLQNRDGGIPTFCRGWGKLQFDRSSPDITAHALLAWSAWKTVIPVASAMARALAFLKRSQRADGAWVPLWFGNQHAANDENPTYGTARVLAALKTLDASSEMTTRARHWLLAAQNSDGGWGGDKGLGSSIEETSLAVSALSGTAGEEVDRGVAWIVKATDSGRQIRPSPIGFYFARLWYFEKLYPLIFAVEALSRVSNSPA